MTSVLRGNSRLQAACGLVGVGEWLLMKKLTPGAREGPPNRRSPAYFDQASTPYRIDP